MVGKQYGMKVVHKPSNMVRSEKWFDTEAERTAAMSGSTMERDYIYVLAEKTVEPSSDALDENLFSLGKPSREGPGS